MSFPQPTDPVDPPLTLEGLAARVLAIEERLANAYFGGINVAVVTESDILESLRKENEQLRVEVLRLGDIVRTFNQQSVSAASVSVPDPRLCSMRVPDLAEFGASD